MENEIKRCYDIIQNPDINENLILLEMELDKIVDQSTRNGLVIYLTTKTDYPHGMADMTKMFNLKELKPTREYITKVYNEFMLKVRGYAESIGATGQDIENVVTILNMLIVVNPSFDDTKLINLVQNLHPGSYDMLKSQLLEKELYEEIGAMEKIRKQKSTTLI